MKVWEYIWLEVAEPVDESIDKYKLMQSPEGEKCIKESIKHHADYRLCLSGLVEKVPKSIYDWWISTPTPCMLKDNPKGFTCTKCWSRFFNKTIGGFTPIVLKGGRNKFGD